MTAPVFALPTTGTDPKISTKGVLDDEVNRIITAIYADLGAIIEGVTFRGDWDASSGSFPGGGSAQRGWAYYVQTGGTVDGVTFIAEQEIIAIADDASTSVFAGSWFQNPVAAVTTAAVRSAGGLMDDEATDLDALKDLDQGVATTDSVVHANLIVNASSGAAGIALIDSSLTAPSPHFLSLGKRTGSNVNFEGKYAAAHLQTDSIPTGSGWKLGQYTFGGNSEGLTEADIRYSASIIAESSAAWVDEDDQKTDLVFRTGQAGVLVSGLTTPGTETLRLLHDQTTTFAGTVNGRDIATDGTKLDAGGLYPEEYSANGAGGGNDTTPINNWMAAVVAGSTIGLAYGAYRLDSLATIELDDLNPGADHISLRGAGMNQSTFLVNNSTGGILFEGTGVLAGQRQHTVQLADMQFEPALASSGYPFKVIGDGEGLSINRGGIFNNITCGAIDESTEEVNFTDGPTISGLYHFSIDNLRIYQRTSTADDVPKFNHGLDISESYYPILTNLWINVATNLTVSTNTATTDGGATIGVKAHGGVQEAIAFHQCVINGADEGLSFERTGREPFFQWFGGHINARSVGMRLNGVKFGAVTGALMYNQFPLTGVDPIDFLIEDADGMTFKNNIFRYDDNNAARRHYWLEPKVGKAGAVVRRITIELTAADLMATITVAPIYLNGATEVTIIIPDATTTGDSVSYPQNLIEMGASQDPREVQIRTTSGGLVSMAVDALAGPTLLLDRLSASPADGDRLGGIRFRGRNSAGERVDYATLSSGATDVTDGTEDGQLEVFIKIAGADVAVSRWLPPSADGDAAMLLLVRESGGAFSLERVTVGADDSAAAGFRVLRVPNA